MGTTSLGPGIWFERGPKPRRQNDRVDEAPTESRVGALMRDAKFTVSK